MKNLKRLIALALISASFAQCASAVNIIPINFQAGSLWTVVSIVYGVSAAVAVVMLVLHTLKWMTADDEQGRMDAKTGIIYVVVALLILMLAGALVSMLYSAPTGF